MKPTAIRIDDPNGTYLIKNSYLTLSYDAEENIWAQENYSGDCPVEHALSDLIEDGIKFTMVDQIPDYDYFDYLVAEARVRAEKAMSKYPQPNYVLNKVAEEHGEVIKAVIHYTENRETWRNVEGELIDNLAMLIRLVKEGDQVLGFTPPDFTQY